MNSHLKNNQKKKYSEQIRSVIIVGATCIAIQVFFPSALAQIFLMIAQPLWSIRDSSLSVSSQISGYVSSKKKLVAENAALHEQVYLMHVKEEEYNRVLSDYDELVSMTNSTSTVPSVLARVISKPPFTPYDVFVINQGSKSGIALGDKVVANDALLIGTVSSIFPYYAYVTLFSSGTASFETNIARTHTSVEVVGRGGGSMQLYVPKDFDVLVGDILTDPRSDKRIIGRVYGVDDTSRGSFKYVYARIPQAIFQTNWVRVVSL